MRKTLFVMLLVIGSLVGPERVAAATKLIYGYSSVGEAMWPLLVAKQRGFFSRNGIDDVEFVLIEGGLRGISAVLGGDVQMMQTGGAPAVLAILRGAPLVILASITNVLFFDFLTPKEITRPSDLKGNRIAISQFGSTTDVATQLLLKRWGISPREVTFLQIGSNPARMAALLNGQIQGALLNSASHSPHAQQRGLKVLASLPEVGIELLQGSIITTRNFRRTQEEFLRRFFKSLVESIAWLRSERNKQDALRILGDFIRTQDERLLERTYQLSQKAARSNPLATQTGLQNILDFVAPIKEAPEKRPPPEHFFDNAFLDQLESSGYIRSLYGK